MATRGLSLGPQETKLLFGLEEKDICVFKTDDAKKILGGGSHAAHLVLSGLSKKGRIRRIERGRYMLVPARAGIEGYWTEDYGPIVGCFAKEYYVGFYSAMDLWDMTEQILYTVFVAVPKRRKNPVVEFEYLRYQFVTLAREKFYGIVESPGHVKFNVSSREKTIVDGLTHPEYCGGIPEVAKAMWNAREEISWDATLEMAERMGVGVVLQRLGYLLEALDLGGGICDSIRSDVRRSSYQCLDPSTVGKKVETSGRYKLVINMTQEDLLGWLDT